MTSADIHIDDFYRDTAKTLVLLYNHFPRTMTLYVEDVSGPDTPDEFGLHSKRHEACLSTLLWLGTAGYLNYTSLVRREAIEEATLTHKAFILLNSASDDSSAVISTTTPSPAPAMLNPLEAHGSDALLINQLRQELQNGTSASLAITVKKVMSLSSAL